MMLVNCMRWVNQKKTTIVYIISSSQLNVQEFVVAMVMSGTTGLIGCGTANVNTNMLFTFLFDFFMFSVCVLKNNFCFL